MEINPCLKEIGTFIVKILRQITYPKEKRAKQEVSPVLFHDLSALLKNSTENNNNGQVIGQKRTIANNDGGNNTPTKVKVDLEILNQVDQEHQIRQNLGDAISERLVSVIKKHWSYEPEKVAILKVQSCKLYNNKYMIPLTQITNAEIFAFIAVHVLSY